MANVHLNHKAIGELLKSEEMQELLAERAEQMADAIRAENVTVSNGEELPVQVRVVETDRAVARVEIPHPAGLAMQAKYGVLTRAATAAGLEVTER